MFSSRLFWKLMLVCAGVSLAAAVACWLMWSRSWYWVPISAVVVCGIGLYLWTSRHLIQPVAALVEGVEAIAAGDYRNRVYVGNRDELGSLARAFNRMSQELDARMQQLGRTSDRLSTVLGGMIEGVIAVDERQRIVFANRAAGLLFEFRPAVAEGRPLLEVVRNHALDEAVSASLATGRAQRLETRREGNERQSVEIHVQPLPGEPCPGVVLVMHDTTELRRLESLRRDFIANVSHELKTPLTSIKAYSETLREGALRDPDASHRFLARIEEQADRLHHLILDMLMLARIESDQQAFEMVTVDLPELVAGCLEDHLPAATAKKIHVGVEADMRLSGGAEECRVLADREGLREILDNLIDNAVKYTPPGGRVTIGWRSTANDSSNGKPFVRIDVRDTGIGIKSEDQRRVFERFYRVDKARSRELGGTGLGLAIVKHLAQSFGGKVSVESEPGKGSTFSVELPQA